MANPTDPDNERFDWGPYARNEAGWATDTQGEDGKLGLGVLLDRAEQQTTIKDAEANIDDYRPLAGRTFEATDIEREYVGDGSSWVQRATRGPNPTFDSATVNNTTPHGTGEVDVTANQSTNESGRTQFSSTGYKLVNDLDFVTHIDTISSGTTFAARLITRGNNDTDGETTTVVPRVFDADGSGAFNLTELEVSTTGTGDTYMDSGWVSIESTVAATPLLVIGIRGKVTGGTGEVQNFSTVKFGGLYP